MKLPALVLLIFCATAAPAHANVVVRMLTAAGAVDIELFEEAAPLTVENFLFYADAGSYDLSFIQRSIPGFVIQGGGFRFLDTTQPPDGINDAFFFVAVNPPTILNEPGISNLRGTIAMAKSPGEANSATTQWFVNVSDNLRLDDDNGGFTVFGDVQGTDMAIVDTINALPRVNAGSINSAFITLPLLNFSPGDPFDPNSQLVYVIVVRSPDQQCGDLDGDLRLELEDIDLLRLALADPTGFPLTAAELAHCSVIGSSEDCDLVDASVLLRRQQGLPPRRSQLCDAANP